MRAEITVVIGVFLGFIAVNLYTLYEEFTYQEPVPYTNVSRNEVLWEKGIIKVSYNFEKVLSCRLESFVVTGKIGDTWTYLEYVDYDPLAPVSREVGEHTLSIGVITDGLEYEEVEIRTTHQCRQSDKSIVEVQKVFTRIKKDGTYEVG